MNNKFIIQDVTNILDNVSRIYAVGPNDEQLTFDAHIYFFNFFEGSNSKDLKGQSFEFTITDKEPPEELFKEDKIAYFMRNGYKINTNSSNIYSFSGLLVNCKFDNNFDILTKLYMYVNV
jgi:hypothetical protein